MHLCVLCVYVCLCSSFFLLAERKVSLTPQDLQTLYSSLKSAAPSWRKIGENLNFEFEELNNITRKVGLYDDENYFQELLSRWLKRTPDKTMKKILADALREAGEERLAYDLEKT